MTKLEITKLAVTIVVGSSAGKVAKDIIKNNLADPEGLENKIKIGIGSVVIGMMVAEAASSHVNDKIDWLAKFWENYKPSNDDPTEDDLETPAE
jgi:uncharacterized membrane protein YeaQ/YmgE (transglycosylase-associated protein family)